LTSSEDGAFISGKGEIQSLVSFRASSAGKETTSGLNIEMEEKEFLSLGIVGDSGFSFSAVCLGKGPSASTISSASSLNTHRNTRLVGELSPLSLLLVRCSPGGSACAGFTSGAIEDDWLSSQAALESCNALPCSPDEELALDEVFRLPVDPGSSHITSDTT
jgi:hypothetical protein